jgi:hypothetical protein
MMLPFNLLELTNWEINPESFMNLYEKLFIVSREILISKDHESEVEFSWEQRATLYILVTRRVVGQRTEYYSFSVEDARELWNLLIEEGYA